MTGYFGRTITYDTIGNPLNDGIWTYTWQNGRELASMTSGNTTWSYTYDANGMRKTRSNGTTTYNYLYNGSQLVQLTRGTDVLYFDHATGTVTWNGTTYYYVYNLQGDVIAILDSAGTAVVNYAYDAWGNLLATTGSMASTLGTLNPLTYRAYIYDHETRLYYLQTRYYNPEVGRFLNADAYTSTGQGILGNNMFAYCGNNPANRADPTGHAFMQMSFDPDGAHGMLTLGPWGGGSGGVAYMASIRPEGVKKLANEVGTAISAGAEACWDFYMQNYYSKQQESQLREAQMISSVSPRIIIAGLEKGAEAAIMSATISSINDLRSNQQSDPKAFIFTVVTSFVGGFVGGGIMEIWDIVREPVSTD